jgi:thiamine phosphate synthase YjbQ (UPF0047 family)
MKVQEKMKIGRGSWNSIILFEISIITGKKEIFITKNIIVM